MSSPDLLAKLAAYVPEPVVQALYRQPQVLTEPSARRYEAAVLFSDISGFTALSELLGQTGPAGAEDLTFLINRYFTQMIQIVHDYQGQVVKFSGDAITVLFPAEATSMQTAIRQAGECALTMQAEMVDFATIQTAQGVASLSMTVGIGAGRVIEAIIGGVLNRWEYVVGGDPLAQVALAERQAQPTQIILSPQAWPEVTAYFVSTPAGDGFVKIQNVIEPLPHFPPVKPDWGGLSWEQRRLAEETLLCFVPGAIKARLNEQAEWLAELRRMTILFVGIGGFDYEAEDTGERLQNFLQATQELIYHFEGSLGKVAVDDKGTVLLILFGAPPFSHEDDTRRAVAYALALQTVAQEQNLRMSIGITEGAIFAGPVGAPRRREYTVIGDQVNLAARLMQYGRAGTILITERVKIRVEAYFLLEDLGQISLKGKASTVSVYQVKGEQDTQGEFITRYLSYEGPLIGREAELVQIRQAADRVFRNRLQLLFIEGELGLGKSRLAAEMVREWITQGRVGYGSRCISYGHQTPYQAWREILSAIFGLNVTLEPSRQLARLASRIAGLSDPPDQPNYWADRLPLLAEVLGLEAPENAFTQHIPSELRRDNTFALIAAILHQQTEQHPLLILLEDIHWADELSLALTHYLAKKLVDRPLFLVVAYRPMSVVDFASIAALGDLPYTHYLELKALSMAESRAVVNTLLNGKSLPAETLEIILERGQGNPFFLQELTGVLLDLFENQQDQPFQLPETLDLPDTVQDVILSRIDRLSESEKLTLKIASVIGHSFQRMLLTRVHPLHGARFVLPAQLEKLAHEKLLRLEAPAPKWEYVFHNVITQEVVYEGLLMAQRRQLHTTVGTVLEYMLPDAIERLAFHYSRSDNLQKALHYLKIAAQKAQREYANRAAIDYYSQIVDFIAERSSQEKDISIISIEYWDAVLQRAQLYNLMGQREAESEDLGTLGIISEALQDPRRRALSAKQWSHLYEAMGNYASGLEMIERAVQLAQEAGDEQLVGAGYDQWGKLLYLGGNYATAQQYFQNALRIAQKYQNKSAQADSLTSLGLVAHYQTDYEVALYFFQEAQALWQEMGDQIGLGRSLQSMGRVYYDMGQYMAARQSYHQALPLYQKIGDRLGEARIRHNLGRVQRSLGNYQRALELLESALTTYQAIGDPRHEAQALCHLGFLNTRLGDYSTALAFLDAAQVILWDLNDLWEQGNLFTYYGWTFLASKDVVQAQRYFEKALQIEQDLQQEGAAMEDVAFLGEVALARDDLAGAVGYVNQVLAYIDQHSSHGMEYPAKVYLICYQILQASKDIERAEAILVAGRQYVAAQAAQIDDEILRGYYLAIPENRQLQELGRYEEVNE